MTTKVAKLQRACLRDPVKVEVAQKYSTVDTLRQQYLFVPAKHKVGVAPIPLCLLLSPLIVQSTAAVHVIATGSCSFRVPHSASNKIHDMHSELL